jgi:hypothetical protein
LEFRVTARQKALFANPFYALLVVVGIVFFVTACAYGVMAFRAVSPHLPAADTGSHPLLSFLDVHGTMLLAAELAILTLATVAAIGTDDYWTRRNAAGDAARQRDRGAEAEPANEPN